MKKIYLPKGSSFDYNTIKAGYLPTQDTVTILTEDISIPYPTVSTNFELINTQITGINAVWVGYNNKILIYDTSGKLWICTDDNLSLINANFEEFLSTLKTTISDQISYSKLKYSSYNDVLYMPCQCEINPYKDNSADMRVLRLSGADYTTVDLSEPVRTHSSRASCLQYEYTYEGKYFLMCSSYVNRYDSTAGKYFPRAYLYTTKDMTTWSTLESNATIAHDEFGCYLSVTSYNGTYYIIDPYGWYFDESSAVCLTTTDPSIGTNGVIVSAFTPTSTNSYNTTFGLHVENGLYMFSKIDGTGNEVIMQNNNFNVVPSSAAKILSVNNRFFKSSVSFSKTSSYISPITISEKTVTTTTVTDKNTYYGESMGYVLNIIRGDVSMTAGVFFSNNYAYQATLNGLARCLINNLVIKE